MSDVADDGRGDAAGMRRIVLASASPRRRALVQLLGLTVREAPQHLAEEAHAVGDPVLSALSVARAKARSGLAGADEGEIVIGSDTVVVLNGAALGKPVGAEEARRMLARLRGRAHTVATGVALIEAGGEGQEWSALVCVTVRMRAYSEAEVNSYVERGEPFDKAGGYAIQDRSFRPVERIDGCYLAVVGLPLCAVARGLETLGSPAAAISPGALVPPCGYCERGRGLVQITGGSAGTMD